MRFFFYFVASIYLNSTLSQELNSFTKERIDFCNANLSATQTVKLRSELNELENYLVSKGLLKNSSGASYRKVFNKIAAENELDFDIDTTFELLHSLDFDVYTRCFYKVLNADQLNEITPDHLEAFKKIAASSENLSPGLLAQRIIDNMTDDDFELEYFKVSTLLVFYRTALPSLEFELPNYSTSAGSNIETIKILLSSNDEIIIDDNLFTLDDAETNIYEFVAVDPHYRGIELKAERGASYEAYIELTHMFKSVFEILQRNDPSIKKNIFINQPE